jgi:DNA repair exonuclease SbcCD ATPase subunit
MQVTIKDIVDFYELYPNLKGTIDVKTRFGYYPILDAAVTAINSEVYELETTTTKILCSPEHKLLSNNKWIMVKDLDVGNILYINDNDSFDLSEEAIIGKTLLPHKEDLYDLQVGIVSEFFANHIVSHNSTISDIICYALFNKPFRDINKPQLINSINGKELLTEIEFDVSGINYKVIRGMKPNIFEIYCNGELLNQEAASKDYQAFLEKQILKFNFNSFTQVGILGAAKFSKFMKLTSQQRRDVIEELLDIKVFSDMSKNLKIKISNSKLELDQLVSDIKSRKDRVTLKESYIKSQEEDKSSKISILEDRLNLITNESNILNDKIQILKSEIETVSESTVKYKSVNSSVTKLKLFKTKFQTNLNEFDENIKKYRELVSCPQCEQDICDTHKEKLINKNLSKIEEQKSVLEDIEIKLQDNLKELAEIESNQKILDAKSKELSKLNSIKSSNESTIREINKQINDLKEDNNELLIREKQSLKEEAEEILKLLNKKELLLQERIVQDNVALLLRDDGIKTSIIRKYLPILNSLINKYLATLDFFVSFEFNEQFEETIKSRYRDAFTYGSFSEGQKLRIDLSIIFAWRELVKQKNSLNQNLLIMDEILDSSIDSEGISLLNNIIFGDSMKGSNVWLISHRPEWADKFHNVIQVDMKNNFTVLKEN